MGNLPNQNPDPQGNNSVVPDQNQQQKPTPPWVEPQVPTQQSGQTTVSSSPVQPTIEPIAEEKPDKPSPLKETETPPQEPAATPMVYKTDGKKEKILKGVKTGGIVLSMFFLSSLTYFSLSLIDKNFNLFDKKMDSV